MKEKIAYLLKQLENKYQILMLICDRFWKLLNF